jgi:protein gp37
VPEKLAEPLRWTDARMIFVNSMSDLFHNDVPTEFITRVTATMLLARWHTYQVLTKRAGRLKQLLRGPLHEAASEMHIWWGVSVENRRHGLPRIADLQAAPASVRFLSVEPLLEDLGPLPLEGISWVIVGGESGPGARPMREEWVLSVQEQCEEAGVPFFFKQWGGVRKKDHGRRLLGRTYDEFPRRIKNPLPPSIVRLQHAARIENSTLVQLAAQ